MRFAPFIAGYYHYQSSFLYTIQTEPSFAITSKILLCRNAHIVYTPRKLTYNTSYPEYHIQHTSAGISKYNTLQQENPKYNTLQQEIPNTIPHKINTQKILFPPLPFLATPLFNII